MIVGPDATYSNVSREWLQDEVRRRGAAIIDGLKEIDRLRDGLRPLAQIAEDYRRTHDNVDRSTLVPVQLAYLLDAADALSGGVVVLHALGDSQPLYFRNKAT